MRFDDGLADVKSKSNALLCVSLRGPVGLEDVGQLVVGDTRPAVRHLERHLAIGHAGADGDDVAASTELERVSKQVADDLDNSSRVTPDLSEILDEVDLERDRARLRSLADVFDFSQYDFDHVWSIEANYNWKIAADNYNECYHCKTTHPDVPSVADLESYDVNTKAAHIQHDAANTDEQRAKGLQIVSTYYWPHASMTVT